MEKRWVLKDPGDPALVNSLSRQINVSEIIASLLVQRGIDDYEKAKRFFRPSLADLYDPFLMKDMAAAVERVEQAIRRRESILFYGDYDVDGTTAVALMYSFFRKRYNKIGYYIPDRYNEGYGISF
jgi:single-stranded-DNA-specific exonuclease